MTCSYGTGMRERAAIKAAYAIYSRLMFTPEKLALLEAATTLTERMDLMRRTPEAQAAWDRWCTLGAVRTKRIYSKSPLYVAKAATIPDYWKILFLDDQDS